MATIRGADMAGEAVYCGNCGTALPPASRFCSSCGRPQDDFMAAMGPASVTASASSLDPDPPPAEHQAPLPPPRAERGGVRRSGRLSPEADELLQHVATQLRAPTVALAGLAALAGLLASLVVGFLAAVALPDRSAIGASGRDTDVVTDGLRLAVAATLADIEVAGFRLQLLPSVFVLAPIAGTAFGAYVQFSRVAGLGPRAQLASAAAAGVPLALAMVLLTVTVGGDLAGFDAAFPVGSVLFLSLLWGALGGVLGTWVAIRRRAPETAIDVVPQALSAPLRAIATPLRALAVLLVVTGALALLYVELQTLRGAQSARAASAGTLDAGGDAERSTAVALVENALSVADLAVATTGLGMFTAFQDPPLPAEFGDSRLRETLGAGREERLFAYRDALPAYVFIPGLLLLIALPVALAVFGGFSTARRMDAPSPAVAVGWGALVGIVWALALVILRAQSTADELLAGSLFASVLLVATLAGALGGFLAGPRPGRPLAAPPTPLEGQDG